MHALTATGVALVLAVGLTVAGCGGGGDGNSGPVVSTSSFPGRAAYAARLATGSNDNFTVSGSCAGTATLTASPATPATFEGVAGFAAGQTTTLNLTNCTPASTAASATAYYDSSYSPLGSSIPGVEYTKFVTQPPPLPASVKVGDTAVYATLTVYTDSTKAVTSGQRVLSYLVEADTASTVIVNLITRNYNSASQLMWTQQTRYRLGTGGTLAIVAIDLQYSTTSTVHLIYTKV
jgi:hypothetical protein